MPSLPAALQNSLNAEVDPAFAARASFIIEQIQTHRPRRVLDAGCGRGYYVQALTYIDGIQEIHGIDIHKDYIAYAQKSVSDGRGSAQITIQEASIYSLPYPDSFFDCIIASEILEHLDNPAPALNELKRVLQPGGMLLITVPNQHFPALWDPLNWVLMKFGTHVPKTMWWLAGIWADHERLYSTNHLRKEITDSGFRIQKIRTFTRHCWPFSHFVLYGIGKNVVERLGANSFNRFDFTKGKKLSTWVASFMAWPSKTFDSQDEDISVDIGVVAKKE